MKLRSMAEIKAWFNSYHELQMGYIAYCGKVRRGYKLYMILNGTRIELYAKNISHFKAMMSGLMDKYPIREKP